MSTNKAWLQELWSGLALGACAGLLAGLFGHFTLWLMLGLLAYLSWHVWHLYRFHHWLALDGRGAMPDGMSIWHELYYQVYRLNKRHRRSRRRLLDGLQQFRVATAAMPEAAIVLSAEGEIIWVNRSAETLVGITRNDVKNRITNLLRFPPFVDYVLGGVYERAVELPSPLDNGRSLSAQITTYGDNQRLLIVRDITLLTQLEQVRRDFVANVSHELRTPLTVISGYLETLSGMDDVALNRYRRPFEQMQQQAGRMRSIIDDLLFLSKVESPRGTRGSELVPVAKLLNVLVAEAQSLSGDQRHEILLTQAEATALFGSEHELRSAFSNLVFNAVRYTPPGGRIELSWKIDQRGGHFSVRDTGVGIAAEHIPRLTERFYRVDASRSRDEGGTGLGLAIVKHVVERHLGTLEITSVLGKGSCFTCHFPLSKLALNRAG
ncbi:MAG: phosphate regulon sensor histidine kinase PhoR [Gammaproteobacteria bacterium]|nr:phosphate regulon sensor histidine kinase PhoR [Gammaproteobacteria bacterium]